MPFLRHINKVVFALTLALTGPSLWAAPTSAADLDDEMQSANIVRSIKVEKLPGEQVRISWIPAGGGGEYVVARATVPISSQQLLAGSIAVGIIPSSESFIVDKGLKPGTYYYAVILRDSIKKKEAVFVSGENYSTSPVVIQSQGVKQITKVPPTVNLIFASLIQKGIIQITWRGIRSGNIVYTVYRSGNAISDAASLKKARKLIEISNGAEYYVDKNLPSSGVFYYAVTTRFKNGIENTKLILEQNYTRDPVEIEGAGDKNITGFIDANKKGKSISVNWKDARNSQIVRYRLYRATGIINSPSKLKAATQIAEVKRGVQAYVDNAPPAGEIYYALISVYQSGGIERNLVRGKNFTSKGVVIGGVAEPSTPVPTPTVSDSMQFEAMRAKVDGSDVKVQWKLNEEGKDDIIVQVYRDTEAMTELGSLDESKKIAEVASSSIGALDKGLSPGDYYYALRLMGPKGLIAQDAAEGVNYLSEPVTIAGAATAVVDDDPDDDEVVATVASPAKAKYNRRNVRSTLYKHFRKGDYKRTMYDLNRYLKSGSITPQAASMARLYIGICQYKTGHPRKAIRYFLHPNVKKSMGKRADFWYRKSLEKIRP